MLSAEQNRLLTEVGPGTPMGNLLRRYWMPIAGVSEFETIAIRKTIRHFVKKCLDDMSDIVRMQSFLFRN